MTERPDWVRPGLEAVAYCKQTKESILTHIVGVGTKFITVSDGWRFNLNTLLHVDGQWTWILLHPDSAEAQIARRKQEVSLLADEASTNARLASMEPDEGKVHELLLRAAERITEAIAINEERLSP